MTHKILWWELLGVQTFGDSTRSTMFYSPWFNAKSFEKVWMMFKQWGSNYSCVLCYDGGIIHKTFEYLKVTCKATNSVGFHGEGLPPTVSASLPPCGRCSDLRFLSSGRWHAKQQTNTSYHCLCKKKMLIWESIDPTQMSDWNAQIKPTAKS